MFGETLFGLEAQTIFDSLILAVNMFVLFLIASYFMINPIKKILNDRQNRIANDREQAKTAREAAEEIKQQYEDKLKDIDREAEAIMSEARRKALKSEEKIVNDAKEEAARIIAHAKAEAELEKKKAADEIKKEIIEVATLMAGKVVAVSVDAKTQDTLIEETLKEIGEETWLS